MPNFSEIKNPYAHPLNRAGFFYGFVGGNRLIRLCKGLQEMLKNKAFLMFSVYGFLALHALLW